jgi:hypothetical protein
MSSVFNVTRDQVIQLALRKLGVLEIGSTPDPETIANASLALNLFIKQMATQGLKIWKVNELALPLTAGKTTYTIGPVTVAPTTDLDTAKPLKVIQAWIRNISVTPYIDTPIQLLSKQEYDVLGSKYSTGVGNSLYANVRRDTTELNLYLTPDSFTATNYVLYFVCQQPMDDINTGSQTPDFPTEWMNTLVWNLADQLAIEYSVPVNHRQEISARAASYKSQLTDWDVEVTSTFFMPDMRSGMFNRGVN